MVDDQRSLGVSLVAAGEQELGDVGQARRETRNGEFLFLQVVSPQTLPCLESIAGHLLPEVLPVAEE